MKKLYQLILLLIITSPISAQISQGGFPRSSGLNLKTTATINQLDLKRLKIDNEIAFDREYDIKNRYSVYKDYNVDIKQKGTKLITDDGNIWRYEINSKNANSISLIFKEFNLPEGADLFIYNKDRSIIYGAFTSKNNKYHGSLAIADFPDQTLIVEYFEPNSTDFEGSLVLGKVGQSYRALPGFDLKSTEYTHVDINCKEGDPYHQQKYSVARIQFEVDGSGYLCSGSLLNNTANDGTPYFLTANHCLSTEKAAQTLVAYFLYEAEECNGPAPTAITLSGSSLLETAKASDVTLLLLDDTPPRNYYPYYAGWNAFDDDSVYTAYGIHHPAGDVKKISIDYGTVYSDETQYSLDGEYTSPAHSFWYVTFDVGYTEGGSSGSPLFDTNNRVIGQLTGGAPDFSWDIYGKISRSWLKIREHLDPEDTSNGILNGYYPATIKPQAHFYTDFSEVCIGGDVKLIDGSAFDIESRVWNISPSSFEYIEGDSSTASPVVSFNEDTVYTISLEANNVNGADIKTRNNYIVASDELNLSVIHEGDSLLCPNSFSSIILTAEGAASYLWKLIDADSIVAFDTAMKNEASITVFRADSNEIVNGSKFSIQFIGIHGNCSDTLIKRFTFDGPVNDSAKKAIDIVIGQNGPFTNTCASVEENEPHPPAGACNSQETWCRCEISDTILDNSVWFTFLAPESGIITIDAPGFDNQIALYKAESADKLFEPGQFTLIAANDDYFQEEKDFSALIENAEVVPGERYFVQVDGSACGAEGDFDLILDDEFYVGIEENNSSIIESTAYTVYPNPFNDYIIVEFDNDALISSYSILTMDGKTVLSDNLKNHQLTQSVKIDLTTLKEDGLFILRLYNGKEYYNHLISKTK